MLQERCKTEFCNQWIYQIMVEREPGPLERRCSCCGKVKPRGWFRKCGTYKSESRAAWDRVRYTSRCRECRRAEESEHAARRRGAGVKRVGRDVLNRLMKRQGFVCACGCGRSLWVGFHVDHVVPVSRGGLHEESNLQLLSPRCNLRKSNKLRAPT